MSIYASFCCMGEDEEIPAPICYRASHCLPTPGDPRAGSLDLGLIPGYITQDGWCVHGVDHTVEGWTDFDHAETCEPSDELPAVWPYLRVGVNDNGERSAVVLLDRSQVEALRDELTVWLNRAVKP